MRRQELLIGLLLGALLTGCASMPDINQIDQRVNEQRDGSLSCPADQPGRCAMDSPLHRLETRDGQHHLMVLDQGEASLVTRLHMIRAAREQILLQNYIVNDDMASRFLLAELVDAARRGVQVRILADALISMPDADLQAALELAHDNLQIRLYNPMREAAVISNRQFFAAALCCFRQLNHRMHNKIVSIDGQHAILGGRNTAGRYFDLDTRMNYLDYEVLVSGPEVARVDASFEEYWSHELVRPARHTRDVASVIAATQTPQTIAASEDRFDYIREQASDPQWLENQWRDRGFRVDQVHYFADPPGKTLLDEIPPERDSTYLLHELIRNAEHTVMIQSPYLVLSKRFRQALTDAGDADITISTNSLASTDAFPVYAISRRERHRLVADMGLNVYEMKPFPEGIDAFVPRYQTLIEEKEEGVITPMRGDTRPPTRDAPGPRLSLHGKLLLVDNDVSVITAHNFDPRSEVYNTENGLIVFDRAFNAELRQFFEKSIAPENSWVSLEKPARVPFLSPINRLMARGSRQLPTLDLWPLYLTENHEQATTDQGEDVTGERGEPVGQFPQVRLGRRLSTGFISRMFGFTKPLM